MNFKKTFFRLMHHKVKTYILLSNFTQKSLIGVNGEYLIAEPFTANPHTTSPLTAEPLTAKPLSVLPLTAKRPLIITVYNKNKINNNNIKKNNLNK